MAYNKYGRERVSHSGYSFASKLEAAVFDILKWREKAKEIGNIRCQAQVSLSRAKIIYKPDFFCTDLKTGWDFYVEAKGYQTPEWRLKRRLWIAYGPATLEIWGGTHTRPRLIEVLEPNRGDDEPAI